MSDLAVSEITYKLSDLSLKPRKTSIPIPISRKSVPKSLKNLLWDTTYGPEVGQASCYVCGVTINSKKFEAGHIVPVSKGGDTKLSNLRCICGTCNKSMGTENLYEFKKRYFGFNKPRPIVNPCWLCKRESLFCRKKIFNCSDHKTICHYKCWKKYLVIASRKIGRKAIFLRQTDCPQCLDIHLTS